VVGWRVGARETTKLQDQQVQVQHLLWLGVMERCVSASAWQQSMATALKGRKYQPGGTEPRRRAAVPQ
jgi:hypothetical protein